MKSVLITGGTGSFGNAMVHKLLGDDFQGRIVIFSRDEKKQQDMRLRWPDKRVEFFIGDVRDLDAMNTASKGMDVLIHAAALKHVPTGEVHPGEVVATNITGCFNVVKAAEHNRCAKVVCLSSDKSVYPVNAYGMTKAIAEKIVVAQKNNEHTVFSNVRYGNVLGSRGSVIPLWIRAMAEGKPFTVTDRAMTRFLLPLREAIDLVLHAIKEGKPGETFVRKSPACRLDTLAAALKQHFGKPNHPEKEIQVRPGEKMHETLITSEEMARVSDLPNGMTVIRPYYAYTLNPEQYEASLDFHREDFTSGNAKQLNVEEVLALLKKSNCLEGETL